MRNILLVAAVALIASACGTDSTAVGPAPVATSLTIVDPGFIRDGDVLTLRAEARAANNQVVNGVPVVWSVVDVTVATITPSGQLTALREGNTEIVATAGTLQHRRPLMVVLHPATTLEVSATHVEVPLGTQGVINTIVRGLDGRALPNRPLTLRSSDVDVVQVSSTGRLTPVHAGLAIVTVSYGTLTASVSVRVPGATAATAYVVKDVDGRPLPYIVESYEAHRDSLSVVRYVTRLESGVVSIGDAYEVTLNLVLYEQTEIGGNTIIRLAGRRTMHDHGKVTPNWLTGTAVFESTYIGNLSHILEATNTGPRLSFREFDGFALWGLGLRIP